MARVFRYPSLLHKDRHRERGEGSNECAQVGILFIWKSKKKIDARGGGAEQMGQENRKACREASLTISMRDSSLFQVIKLNESPTKFLCFRAICLRSTISFSLSFNSCS